MSEHFKKLTPESIAALSPEEYKKYFEGRIKNLIYYVCENKHRFAVIADIEWKLPEQTGCVIEGCQYWAIDETKSAD